MRTNTPRYRVFLKDREIADGSRPVIIRISFHGTVEKSLGFSVKPKDWDETKQRVKPKATNAKALNAIIDSFIKTYEEQRIKLDVQGSTYTASTLNQVVETTKEPQPSEMTFREATERFYQMRCSSTRTRTLYDLYLTRVEEIFSKKAKVIQADVAFMSRLTSQMKKDKRSNQTIFECVSYVSAIVNFANEQGFIKTDTSIFARFRKQFRKIRKNERVIVNETQVAEMMKWLMKRLYVNGKEIATWESVPEIIPRTELTEMLSKPTTPEFAMAFALMSYYLGGLAPCDLAQLKVGDVRIREGRFVLVGTRRKTSVQYFVARTYSDKLKALFNPFIEGKANDELLLPVYNHYHGERAINTFESKGRKKLLEAVQMINEEINAEEDDEQNPKARIPDAERQMNNKTIASDRMIPDGLSFYSMRHSYATAYIRKSNDVGALAASMGRSVAGIGTYCRELSEESDMASRMDLIG